MESYGSEAAAAHNCHEVIDQMKPVQLFLPAERFLGIFGDTKDEAKWAKYEHSLVTRRINVTCPLT